MVPDLFKRRDILLLPLSLMLSSVASGIDIQRLIDNAQSGETVRLPPGRILIEHSLVIRKSIKVVGSENSSLVKERAGMPIIRILSSDVTLREFSIVGSGKFTNQNKDMRHNDAIVIGDNRIVVVNILIELLTIKNVGDSAIAIESSCCANHSATVTKVRIIDSVLIGSNVWSNYHAGIFVNGASEVRVERCDVSEFGQCIFTKANTRQLFVCDCHLHHTSKQHAVYLSGSTEDVVVKGNTLAHLQGTGIKCSAPNTVIRSNKIVSPKVWGINLKADLDNIEISDNLILDCGNDGIDSGFEQEGRTQSNIVIKQNRIINAGDCGINFAHDRDRCTYRNIIIVDNVIRNAVTFGIKFGWNRVVGSLSDGITLENNGIFFCGKIAIRLGSTYNASMQRGMRRVTIANNEVLDMSIADLQQLKMENVTDVLNYGNNFGVMQ